MSAWLTIIGVGDDGIAGLAPPARAALDEAEIVVGSKRLLEQSDLPGKDCHAWASPMHSTIDRMAAWKPRSVAVLATGDPMHFGIGCTLARRFSTDEMRVLPAPSAFSLAAARLGWPLQEVECISLHGRSVALLEAALAPGVRILALTSGAKTIAEAVEILIRRNYGESRLAILEHMGGAAERRTDCSPAEALGREFADFNLLAIECAAAPGADVLPRGPGLPDTAFRHDGQLTKQDVRAVTMAALRPAPRARLWDVGAGCGSIAIEWMRAAPQAMAIAFEADAGRTAMIRENAQALGAPGLEIVHGVLPGTLEGQAPPDTVFHGGAVADEAVFSALWGALSGGGRLVANAVTLESEAALIARQARLGGELVRIDISHSELVGSKQAMRPKMSVLQWRVVKE